MNDQISMGGEPAATGGKRRALIIACDRYSDSGLAGLRAPAADARALAAVLGDPLIGDFAVDLQIDPASHELAEVIEGFFVDAAPTDLLLLHIACHGMRESDGELYFAARDTRLARLHSTALSSAFVNSQMARSPSKKIILMLDCCFSGAFGGRLPTPGWRGGQPARPVRRPGQAVLTASSALEYAFEDGVVGGQPSTDRAPLLSQGDDRR